MREDIKLLWDAVDKNIYIDGNGRRISHDEVVKPVEKR